MSDVPILIGVSGGSGSGKSTICRIVSNHFYDCCSIVSYDSYYKCLSDFPTALRKAVNFDHPDALDTNLLVEHLHKLKNGEVIYPPIYDFITHTRKTSNGAAIWPTKFILVEGVLLYSDTELVGRLDHKVFIDIDSDLRFIRRLTRDIDLRGRSFESVVSQYFQQVKPMYNKYVEPMKVHADLIVRNECSQDASKHIIEYLEELVN